VICGRLTGTGRPATPTIAVWARKRLDWRRIADVTE